MTLRKISSSEEMYKFLQENGIGGAMEPYTTSSGVSFNFFALNHDSVMRDRMFDNIHTALKALDLTDETTVNLFFSTGYPMPQLDRQNEWTIGDHIKNDKKFRKKLLEKCSEFAEVIRSQCPSSPGCSIQ